MAAGAYGVSAGVHRVSPVHIQKDDRVRMVATWQGVDDVDTGYSMQSAVWGTSADVGRQVPESLRQAIALSRLEW